MKKYSNEKEQFRALLDDYQGDLSFFLGKTWEEICITEAGLVLPGWRRPFTAAELRSTFMRLQLLNCYEHENRRLRKERQTAWEAMERAEDACAWYRSQLRLESSYGLMLAGVAA